MYRITYHGHSAFDVATADGLSLWLDPWLDGNPVADIGTKDVTKADFILVSHGHGDHFSDVVKLAKQTGATVIGAYELIGYCETQGLKNVRGMGIGGGGQFPFGYVKLTPALHGPGVDGADGKVTTTPNGFFIDMNGQTLYHAGDTALTMDMQLLRDTVDVALLPIGDNFTMGPEDAARAVEMIKPRVVVPMHYNTFDLLKQDPDAFAKRVGATAKTVIMKPGDSFEV